MTLAAKPPPDFRTRPRSWTVAANLRPGDRIPAGTIARVEVEAGRPVRIALATGEAMILPADAAMEIAP